jgi:flagellar basal body-associated protein FliL
MAPPTAPATDKADAASAPATAPPKRLMSPAGYIVVSAVMLLTAGVVYFVTKNFHNAAPRPAIHEEYEEIDLGQFSRELAPAAGDILREQFMVRIYLQLNPHFKDIGEMKALVEKRKNLLKDIVGSEIINPKSDAEFRSPGILETLRTEIKQRINTELGAQDKEGQEIIQRVIFPDTRLPNRR